MKPLRLAVFDATDLGIFAGDSGGGADGTSRRGPGLSPVWGLGARLFGSLGAFEAWSPAHTWAEALRWAVDTSDGLGRPVTELQAWGHGGFGFMRMASAALDRSALGKTATLAPSLDALRDALDPGALVWLRCCSAFGDAAGRSFASMLADRLGVRVAGHTHIIHALQSGTHSLGPGQSPGWDAAEGVSFEGGRAVGARTSRLGAPHTITCLHPRLPQGY